LSGRFAPYDEYQDTQLDWLGKVPNHWELRRLGGFFKDRREKVSDKDFAALSVTMQGIDPQLEDAAKTKDGDNRNGKVFDMFGVVYVPDPYQAR